MRVGYVSVYDSSNVRNWSGTGYHIARALSDQGVDVVPFGPLKYQRNPINVARYLASTRVFGQRDHPHRDPGFLRHLARQVDRKLRDAGPIDLLFGPGLLPLVHVTTDLPIAIWTDCTFASMVDYYESFTNLSARTLRNGHQAESIGLKRCAQIVMACDWAAESAVRDYGVDPDVVAVAPFGANLAHEMSESEVEQVIASRPEAPCRLLFIGVDWVRKGGQIAVDVTRELNERGRPAELIVVGCDPPPEAAGLPYVRPEGFIDKNSPAGVQRMGELLRDAHFMLVPTRAECFGIVFCEANAHGVPAVTTRTGGTPSVVTDDVNGRLFEPDAPPAAQAEWILGTLDEPGRYAALARSSYGEYRSRLNWRTSGARVVELLERLLA